MLVLSFSGEGRHFLAAFFIATAILHLHMLSDGMQTKMNSQHEELLLLTEQLSDEQFVRKPSNGKWSIQQNIAHLGRYQYVFLARLRLMSVESPKVPRYSADEDPGFHDWVVLKRESMFERLMEGRQQILNYMSNLSKEDFQKSAIHPVFGLLTMSEWTHFFLLHESHHLLTIFQLVKDAKG